VKRLIRMVVDAAHRRGRKVGICGQAPSDFPDFAEYLAEIGIDSISLNPDSLARVAERLASDGNRSPGQSIPVVEEASAPLPVLVGAGAG
jgi:phosphoenolpyruvate synthase/pyruvate phosphate dikinase